MAESVQPVETIATTVTRRFLWGGSYQPLADSVTPGKWPTKWLCTRCVVP